MTELGLRHGKFVHGVYIFRIRRQSRASGGFSSKRIAQESTSASLSDEESGVRTDGANRAVSGPIGIRIPSQLEVNIDQRTVQSVVLRRELPGQFDVIERMAIVPQP